MPELIQNQEERESRDRISRGYKYLKQFGLEWTGVQIQRHKERGTVMIDHLYYTADGKVRDNTMSDEEWQAALQHMANFVWRDPFDALLDPFDARRVNNN
jgi:hypothetical protein